MLTVGIPSAVKDLSLSNVALACLLLVSQPNAATPPQSTPIFIQHRHNPPHLHRPSPASSSTYQPASHKRQPRIRRLWSEERPSSASAEDAFLLSKQPMVLLLQAISRSEEAYPHSEMACLHSEKALSAFWEGLSRFS